MTALGPSKCEWHCKDCPILRSECLQIFDQRPLIRVAQSGVAILDIAGAEVMTPADDEVGTFAELEQRLDQVGEDLFRLVVTCPSRKRLKVAPGLDHKLQHLLAMREPRCRIRAFRQRAIGMTGTSFSSASRAAPVKDFLGQLPGSLVTVPSG